MEKQFLVVVMNTIFLLPYPCTESLNSSGTAKKEDYYQQWKTY